MVSTHSEPVKQVIGALLALSEVVQVLEDLSVYRDLVVVAYGVLAKEVKLHHTRLAVQLLVQCWGGERGRCSTDRVRLLLTEVLHSERAAAHGVRTLVCVLLIARPQSQLVYEVHSHRPRHTHTHTV